MMEADKLPPITVEELDQLNQTLLIMKAESRGWREGFDKAIEMVEQHFGIKKDVEDLNYLAISKEIQGLE